MAREDQAHSNLQHHASEKAILAELLKSLNSSLGAMEESLQGYITSTYISTTEVPADLHFLQVVLSRFYAKNELKDIFDLVGNRPELLNPAISVTKVATADETSLYQRAESALKLIKANLETYQDLDTVETVKKPKHTEYINKQAYTTPATTITTNLHDGFTKYYEHAEKIIDFVKAWDSLTNHGKCLTLTPQDLPNSVKAAEKKLLALAPPPSANNPNHKDSDSSDNEPVQSTKFEVGGEKDRALLNKYACEVARQQISKEKMECNKVAILKRLEFNTCSIKHTEDADNNCASLNNEYLTAKMNCESHFPMVTISDKVMEQLYKELEILEGQMTADGRYMLDMDRSLKAVDDYGNVIGLINDHGPAPLAALPYDPGCAQTKLFIAGLPSEVKTATTYSGVLMIGAGSDAGSDADSGSMAHSSI